MRLKDKAVFLPPSVGGLDLSSSNRGCARRGSEVALPSRGVFFLAPPHWGDWILKGVFFSL